MANLVELSNDLEFVPKEQLIQMSQDPNSTFPTYLVLAEIQRRTQMEKMYDAQQPKPQTSVAEELIAEFAGSPSGLGAMAQSFDTPNAFQSSDMGDMAPPSPMQMMANGGKTGYYHGTNILSPDDYQSGGLTGYKVGGLTDQTIKEANALGIDITNLSDEEIVRQVKLANEQRRKNMLLGMTPNLNELPITQPLPTSPEDLLNLPPLPEGIQTQIDAAKEPSRFDEIIEGGTQFFFGDPRPDAKRPNLARATDEFTDYLSLIPGATGGLKLGASGLKSLIQRGKGLKQSGKLDDIIEEVIDFTKRKPTTIPNTKVDNILPKNVTNITPRGVTNVPSKGVTNIPTTLGPPRPTGVTPGTNLVPQTGTSLVTQTGTSLVPQGGPLAVIPKITKESKGLMNRAIDFLKNNKTAAGILTGISGGLFTTYYAMQDQENLDLDDKDDDNKLTTKEIKQAIDPLDLAKLGGIIMGARNTSELGQGITALAGDIQERRYKEKVLTSKGLEALQDKYNIFIEELQRLTDAGKQDTPQYRNTELALANIVAQLQGLSGAEGTDFAGLLDSVTVKKKVKSDTESKGIAGALKDTFFRLNPLQNVNLIGSKLAQNYFNNKPTSVIPQSDLYNAFVKNAPNPDYLTGDPIIDNIMRVESGGQDLTNTITGATGPLQVKEMTLANPGYGVKPAKDNSVEEKIRVGKDYYIAMREEFDGNDLYASIAYNLGPSATKKWLESGGSIEQLRQIQSSDGRPVGQAAIDYITKLYGPDIITRLA